MKLYVGSDHGGYEMKEFLKEALIAAGHEIVDCGSYSPESTDYPDFALAVGKAVLSDPQSLGILACRSGEGMEIAANKLLGIRAALVWNPSVSKETRSDNDANIMVLPADYLSNEEARDCAVEFISTPFSGEDRHVRRLEKLKAIEKARYES